MRSLERRCHEEDPLYQVATYLASLDQLFDEQASIPREQTHRAEQTELAVRLQQILRQEPQPRSVVKQLPKRASGRPGTCVYKNGPEVERQSRQLEKPMSYLVRHHVMGTTFWDPTSPTREP